ncbi:MAG: putative lipid II flippase FtsW [Candidatus Staskawiczbacteria bacterium]|nr:putative lipid II flippase FtsW [Candidatus Staskawiczbacteria bacterium]
MKRRVNYYFLMVAGGLLTCGLLFLSTLSAIASLKIFGNTNYYIFHQLISVAIGLVGGVIMFKLPLPFLKKIAPVLFIVNILLVLAVFLPGIGVKLGGAHRWINIAGNTLQPSEFLKITAILFISAWLSNRISTGGKKNWGGGAKKSFHNFISIYLPFLVFLIIIGFLLLLQRDMSTLGIVCVTLITIYFIAQTPVWHTLLTFILGISSALILIIIQPYRLERLMTFLNPGIDPMGMGHQISQAKLAIGSGGIFGKGLGMSVQKFGALPEPMTDSIFAIVGEELGLIGASALILVFATFVYLGFKIAHNATDKFAKLTAIGLCTWIVFQAFINMASSVGLFPLAGIPLPFFSYGGSHIIAEIIAVGLLLNISKNG